MRHFMAQFGPSLQWPWTQADGRSRTHRRAARPPGRPVRRPGRGPVDPRARSVARRLPGRGDAGPPFGHGRLRRRAVLDDYDRSLYRPRPPDRRRAVGRCRRPADAPDRRADRCRPSGSTTTATSTTAATSSCRARPAIGFLDDIGLDEAYLAIGPQLYTPSRATSTTSIRPTPATGSTSTCSSCRTMRSGCNLFTWVRRSGTGDLIATVEYMLLHASTAESRALPAARRSLPHSPPWLRSTRCSRPPFAPLAGSATNR